MEHSESIKEIAKALAGFQSEVKDPARTGENPHFKSEYVQINELLKAVRPELSKHGLSVIQSTGGDGQNISVSTLILHTSGEWIQTDALVLRAQQVNPQGAGSAVTYGRRYNLSAALGVAWDDDDDGNAASEPTKEQSKEEKPSKAVSYRKVQDEMKRLKISGEDIKAILKMQYGKTSSNALTVDEMANLAEHIGDYAVELMENEAKLMEGI